jgi:pullulanase
MSFPMLWLFWRRPTIHFYKPDADAVSLVIEGHRKPRPMKRDQRGNWCVRLQRPYRDLHGRAYHFEVRKNARTFTVADPLARGIERNEQGFISRFRDSSYQWQHNRFKTPPFRDVVIYETHLPALSRHSSAKVEDESYRGTYAGARSPAILAHLQRLKVAVEFLPLHASDKSLGQDWGYFTTSFHSMRECFALNKSKVNEEFMAVIDAMHRHDIPVLLDVVFNHGGELWVKAWGKDIVYRKHDNGDFCHGSGCGPTIRTEHPMIRETIIQTLEHLVNDYQIDGFRFDLGALHDKQTMMEIDRRLPEHVYLIAEPWALGGTQWGKGDMSGEFAATRWAVWNDDFRETGKTFLMGRGDRHNRDRLMRAIKGSHVDDGGWAQRPQQSINYLSSHDGKTLADLVEGNKQRLFLGVLMVLTSQGVPMLGEGTELMFSKQGHDNSYNRPDLNQIDWTNAHEHADLVDAVAGLIALRKSFANFRYPTRLKQRHEHGNEWDIDWIYTTGYPHRDNSNTIGFELKPPPLELGLPGKRRTLVILLNGSTVGADFYLPKGKWKLLVDGLQLAVNAQGLPGIPHVQGNYHIHPGTGVILECG